MEPSKVLWVFPNAQELLGWADVVNRTFTFCGNKYQFLNTQYCSFQLTAVRGFNALVECTLGLEPGDYTEKTDRQTGLMRGGMNHPLGTSP